MTETTKQEWLAVTQKEQGGFRHISADDPDQAGTLQRLLEEDPGTAFSIELKPLTDAEKTAIASALHEALEKDQPAAREPTFLLTLNCA